MFNFKVVITYILIILITACSAKKPTKTNNLRTAVDGLQIETYGEVGKAKSPALIIFLHGDSCRADYTKEVAEPINLENVLSIVMARPGCEVSGRRSQGSHGDNDHYTSDKIAAVAKSINSLKQHYKASKVVIVGHSGGAATAGIIVGKYPELANAMVAVSFPANVPKWRIHRNKGNIWMKSLSPHDFINNIKSATKIYIVNGNKDKNTPPSISEGYVDTAKTKGLDITHVILNGEGHNSALKSFKVRSIINSLIERP